MVFWQKIFIGRPLHLTLSLSLSSRTNPIKSVRNVLRFGRSRSSSVEEDERALVSNPNIAAVAAANESSDTDAIRRFAGNGAREDVESGT